MRRLGGLGALAFGLAVWRLCFFKLEVLVFEMGGLVGPLSGLVQWFPS